MKVVDKILEGVLGKFIDIASMTLLSVLVVVVFVGICFRYFLNLPLAWSNELSQFLLVWLTFFGAAAATRRSRHLRIDDIINTVKPKTRLIIVRVTNALIVLFLVFMILRGTSMARNVWNSKSEALHLSNGLLYLPLAVGFLLMVPYHLRRIFAEEKEKTEQ